MNSLTEAVLALLTYSPEKADVIVRELRQWTDGGVYKGPPWQPGDVLSVLDLLILNGKAVQVKDRGYCLLPDRPKEQQGSMFG